MALGTVIGVIERKDNAEWDERFVTAGLAVGIVYAILGVITFYTGFDFGGLLSMFGQDGPIFLMFNNIFDAEAIVLPLSGVIMGLIETYFGGIFYEAYTRLQDLLTD